VIIREFNIEDIVKDFDKFANGKKETLAMAASYACTSVVNEAKNKGSYTDRTSNLRSSIGFKVDIDGKEHKKEFDGKNSEGVEAGKQVARANIDNKGVSMIIVAGMNYAGDVEMRGKSVLNKFLDEKKIWKEIRELTS